MGIKVSYPDVFRDYACEQHRKYPRGHAQGHTRATTVSAVASSCRAPR